MAHARGLGMNNLEKRLNVKRHVKKATKTQSLQMEYLRIFRDNIKCTSGSTSGMLRKGQPFVYCFSKVRDATPSSQRRQHKRNYRELQRPHIYIQSTFALVGKA